MRNGTSSRLWLATAVFASLIRIAMAFELPDPHLHHGTDKKDRNDLAAIRYLGTVDCVWYPESQEVLLQTLQADPRELVRYAAAQSLFDQMQRGRKPLKPLNGRREFPDPFILSQIATIATLHEPLSTEQLLEMYAERKMERELEKHPERADVQQCGCSADKAIPILGRIASAKDEFDCFIEPSERVRRIATDILVLLEPEVELYQSQQRKTPQPKPDSQTPELPQDPFPELPSNRESRFTGSYLQRANIILGRADTANRFNFFDNMGASPQSRVFGAYQFAQSQNNAIAGSANLEELFSLLSTSNGQEMFKSGTGYGSGLGNQPLVITDNLGINGPAAQQLRDLYTVENSGTGRTEDYLIFPDSNIYRLGFEYALTPDFSFAVQGQYVAPIASEEQPADFTNPLIQLKQVLFRDDLTVLSGVVGISPEIRHRSAAIQEKTSRLNPGILFQRQSADDDRWFLQGGTGFSIPTRENQITTWDYGLSVGRFIYRHESLLTQEPTDKFLLGIIPQLEVLGKEIVGSNVVTSAFGLSSSRPHMAPGTFNDNGTLSTTTGTTDIYFPQDPGRRFDQAVFVYSEPRHVVDLTMGTSFLFSKRRTLNLALSVPVTGGSARALEVISSFSAGF